MGEVTDAMTSFNQALEIIPNHPGALRGKAGLLIIHRNFSEAEKVVDKLSSIAPNEPGIKQMKVAVYLFQDKFEEALRHINEVLETDPSNPDVLMMKAMALHNLKQYHEASLIYDKVLEAKPGDKFTETLRSNAINKIDIDMPPLPGVVTKESFNEEMSINNVHTRCVASFNEKGLAISINASSTEKPSSDSDNSEYMGDPDGGYSGAVAHGFNKMAYVLNNLFGPDPPPVPPLTILSISLIINGKAISPNESNTPSEDSASATFT